MPGPRGWWLAAGIALAAAAPVAAQETARPAVPILTLDQERLFTGSRAAEQISEQIEAAAERLAEENRRIEAELTAEELALTEQRPSMDPEAFRALADAFDQKVTRLREEQDAKALDLQRRRDQDRQTFLRQITPLLAEIVRERGALVVLDRRSVLLSADSIDITDQAIARINDAFEADEQSGGAPAPDPAPAPDAAPEPAPGDAEPAPQNGPTPQQP